MNLRDPRIPGGSATQQEFVTTQDELAVVNSFDTFDDLTDVEQRKTDIDNATIVTIAFSDLGSAVATIAYITFNADDNTDADKKLTQSANRVQIKLGDSITVRFSKTNPLTRIDAKSDDAAPVGGANSLSFVISRPE